MQISINDRGHVIRILPRSTTYFRDLLHIVLTIECLRGLSIESKGRKWSGACVYLCIASIGQIG